MSRSILLAFVAAVGCSHALPTPPLAEHPARAYRPVPFPPPPARAEFVPRMRDPEAVWIDGEWLWRGIRWTWIYGRWVRPQPGASWAPSSWRRGPDGKLLVAPGTWHDAAGRALPHPPALRIAGADEGDVVEDEGLLEDVAPDERASERSPPAQNGKCRFDRLPAGDATR